MLGIAAEIAKQAAGGLTKLKISKVGDTNPLNAFELPINPSTVTVKYGVEFDDTKPQGKVKVEQRFAKYGDVTVDFEIIFDGTGAYKFYTPLSTAPDDVKDQIDDFKKLCYDYDGKKHEPNVVTLSWGSTLSLDCRLTSLSLKYELFKSNGDPLRVRANVTFREHTESEDEPAIINKNSPDLSHFHSVREGDTLPLMCNRVYGNSSLYLVVAKVNGITNFRNLRPGSEILFPPIKK